MTTNKEKTISSFYKTIASKKMTNMLIAHHDDFRLVECEGADINSTHEVMKFRLTMEHDPSKDPQDLFDAAYSKMFPPKYKIKKRRTFFASIQFSKKKATCFVGEITRKKGLRCIDLSFEISLPCEIGIENGIICHLIGLGELSPHAFTEIGVGNIKLITVQSNKSNIYNYDF